MTESINKSLVIDVVEARRAFEMKRLSTYEALILILTTIIEGGGGNDRIKNSLSELDNALSRHGKNIEPYFCGHFFVSLISDFELFLTDSIRAVIAAYPRKVGGTTFKLEDILDGTQPEELVQRAAEEYLNKLMYKKPSEYISDFKSLLSVDLHGQEKFITIFFEAKARRDIGVHNDWKINNVYLRKISDLGIDTLPEINSLAIPDTEQFQIVSRAFSSLAESIQKEIEAKFVF